MTLFSFVPAGKTHQALIFSWLDEPHVQAFWDNSLLHREDIQNFIGGRKAPSSYFNGIFDYWVGCADAVPFCMLMTSEWKDSSDLTELHRAQLSQTGKTLGIDFLIGHPDYLGKGLAAPTLKAFMHFVCDQCSDVKKFFIDPSNSNPRAIHVYEQAGFVKMGDFVMPEGVFKGQTNVLMVKDV